MTVCANLVQLWQIMREIDLIARPGDQDEDGASRDAPYISRIANGMETLAPLGLFRVGHSFPTGLRPWLHAFIPFGVSEEGASKDHCCKHLSGGTNAYWSSVFVFFAIGSSQRRPSRSDSSGSKTSPNTAFPGLYGWVSES